jgi:adenylate cyclase
MGLTEFLREVDEEVGIITAADYEVEVVETDYVPSFSDSSLTFDNLDLSTKRCKLLGSCRISVERKAVTLSRMYSAFVRSMLAAARFYGGHVRNIIGDRVMVVFDRQDCFSNAIDTAILMNSLAQRIVNRRLKAVDFRCGIGIDYGKMLIVKAGTIRRGSETEFYRSLVWLGRPANIASKLTDLANKTTTWNEPGIMEGHYYPALEEWGWYPKTYEQFVDKLETTFSPTLHHKEGYFSSFFKHSLGPFTSTTPPILCTAAVYDGLKSENPDHDVIRKPFFRKRSIAVPGYAGGVYGGDVIHPVMRNS